MVTATPGRYAILALLALIPVAAFILDRADPSVGLAILNVLLIAVSLYFMFSSTNPQPHASTGH